MLSKKLLKALNDQINLELYSWYLYLSMSSWFKDQNLPGMSNWMMMQAKEEMEHARKIWGYIFDRRQTPVFEQIDKPKLSWKSPIDAFKDAFKHEQAVTKSIHKLYELAQKEKDHAAVSFIQWFVDEQVEEEATVDEIITRINNYGDFKGGIFLLDGELAGRTAPATE